MENYGSEIGQKMRSAVKAKLLELGTGGETGYIDDELPDYVMIMVANKRSKEQMISDLNLFLGSQTGLFVTWLHEVLQKLQEVTLPAVSAAAATAAAAVTASGSKKRKSGGQKEEPSTRRDKKSSKRDKKGEVPKRSHEATTTSEREAVASGGKDGAAVAILPPTINSITDVFAEDLLEKAKKTLDLDMSAAANIKKGKGKQRLPDKDGAEAGSDANRAKEGVPFDIPTTSEISSTTEGAGGDGTAASGSGNREKDLAELADIQRKIQAAKKHLKEIGELQDDDESDDEDFLNLRDDGSRDEFNDAGDLVQKGPQKKSAKPKSPIVFEAPGKPSSEEEERPCADRSHTPPTPALAVAVTASQIPRPDSEQRREASRPRRSSPEGGSHKRPVHERLGMRGKGGEEPKKEEPSRQARPKKELYVPVFRRKELESHVGDDSATQHRQSAVEERSRPRERPRRSSPTTSRGQRLASQVSTTEAGGRRREASREREQRAAADEEQPPAQQRHRIGSRVIVAPAKPQQPSDDEDLLDKPVNSVIKIKPRPPVSPSKQACKNLLMRAVAEAQRSTILAKSDADKEQAGKQQRKEKDRLERQLRGVKETASRTAKVSIRERLSRGGVATATVRRTARTLVVELERGQLKRSHEGSRRQAPSKAHALSGDEWEKASAHDGGGGEDRVEEEDVAEESTADGPDDDDEALTGEEYVPNLVGSTAENPRRKETAIQSSTTQFVVTLNENKKSLKYKPRRGRNARSRTASPLPQVSSSSAATQSNGVEASSTTRVRASRRASLSGSRKATHGDVRTRLTLKADTSTQAASGVGARDSSASSPNRITPPLRRTERIEVYRKSKEIKKIIISNDTDDEDALSPPKNSNAAITTTTGTSGGHTPRRGGPESRRPSTAAKRRTTSAEERSTTPPLPPKLAKARTENSAEKKPQSTTSPYASPQKRKRTPIRFDMEKGGRGSREKWTNDSAGGCGGGDNGEQPVVRRRSRSRSRSRSRTRSRSRELRRDHTPERRPVGKISIRNTEARKYDHIPSLSSVTMESSAVKVVKPKERCKYHPNCTKQFCDYYHPTAPCKSFPNCKYADKCMYSHPKCKYDMSCTNIDCNYSHSGPRSPTQLKPTAPPLSSSVVPVQNYKSITAAVAPPPAASVTMCKYFPNCSKVGCTFFHPKPCRFGRNCINRHDCNFYHHELQSSSKFKWVASIV